MQLWSEYVTTVLTKKKLGKNKKLINIVIIKIKTVYNSLNNTIECV